MLGERKSRNRAEQGDLTVFHLKTYHNDSERLSSHLNLRVIGSKCSDTSANRDGITSLVGLVDARVE